MENFGSGIRYKHPGFATLIILCRGDAYFHINFFNFLTNLNPVPDRSISAPRFFFVSSLFFMVYLMLSFCGYLIFYLHTQLLTFVVFFFSFFNYSTYLDSLFFTSWCSLSFLFSTIIFPFVLWKLLRLLMPCFLLSSEHGVKQREQGPGSHRVDCQQAGTGMQAS